MKYSIAIVDDHILIAKALTEIIERKMPQFNILYEVENGQALMERMAVPVNIPDIVLLDISMPVMDGFATAAWLRKEHPAVLVLALSMQEDESSLIRMIKNGVRGYLLKNIHPVELEKALESLVQKGFYHSEWATNKVMITITGEDITASSRIEINERENEFLQYAITELSYKEIGEKMFCSSRTVEAYRDSLFEKTGLKTRVALVVYAIKNGWIKI